MPHRRDEVSPPNIPPVVARQKACSWAVKGVRFGGRLRQSRPLSTAFESSATSRSWPESGRWSSGAGSRPPCSPSSPCTRTAPSPSTGSSTSSGGTSLRGPRARAFRSTSGVSVGNSPMGCWRLTQTDMPSGSNAGRSISTLSKTSPSAVGRRSTRGERRRPPTFCARRSCSGAAGRSPARQRAVRRKCRGMPRRPQARGGRGEGRG